MNYQQGQASRYAVNDDEGPENGRRADGGRAAGDAASAEEEGVQPGSSHDAQLFSPQECLKDCHQMLRRLNGVLPSSTGGDSDESMGVVLSLFTRSLARPLWPIDLYFCLCTYVGTCSTRA